jgi:hypothetical protein
MKKFPLKMDVIIGQQDFPAHVGSGHSLSISERRQLGKIAQRFLLGRQQKIRQLKIDFSW